MCIMDFCAAVCQSHYWQCSDIDPLGLGLGPYVTNVAMKALKCKPRPCLPKHAHSKTPPAIVLAGSHTQLHGDD